MKRTALVLATISFLLAAGLSCGPSGDGVGPATGHGRGGLPRGIVLVSVDAIRPDLLSTYGGKVEAAGLDALARSGVAFENAATVCPMARPAVAALLTGLAPDRTGVRDDTADRLPDDAGTLAQAASAAGWKTAAFVTTPFCSHGSGFERGFDSFDAPRTLPVGPAQFYPIARSAESAAAGFSKWLDGVGPSESFFAWLHLGGASRLAAWGGVAKARDAYEQELRRTDACLATVRAAIEKSGRIASTDVVFVGTHGVLLGEDGARGSSFWLREETVKVPLVVAGPLAAQMGGEEGRDRRKVWLPDVGATLRARIAPGARNAGDGVDLADPRKPGAERARYAWTWAPDDQVAWPTLTAVDTGARWTSFSWDDLKDPEGRGEAWSTAAARPAAPRARALSDASRTALAAAGIRLGPSERREEPPPDGGTAFYGKLVEARVPFAIGVLHRANELTAALLESHPDNFAAQFHRMLACLLSADTKAAWELSERLLSEYPLRKDTLHWAAHAAFAAREVPRAEALLRAAIEVGPVEPEMIYDLACARALQGDGRGAIEKLREAVNSGYRDFRNIERDPDLASIRSDPGYAEVLRNHAR